MTFDHSTCKGRFIASAITLLSQSYTTTVLAQSSHGTQSIPASSAPQSPHNGEKAVTSVSAQTLLPSSQIDAAPVPAIPPAPDVLHRPETLRFEANLDDVRLMIRREPGPHQRGPQYDYICTAPCEEQLSRDEDGLQRISLSLGGRSSIDIPGSVPLSGKSILRGIYDSRASLRAGGLVILVAGTVVGGVIASAGTAVLPQNTGTGVGLISSGGAFSVASLVVGLILSFKGDRASVEVLPPSAVLSAPAGGTSVPDRSTSSRLNEGVAVRLRF